MKTNREKMLEGLLYDCNDKEILDEQIPYIDKLFEFNQLRPTQLEEKQKYMKAVFAGCGDNCYIELPFRANWGGHHVHFGNNVYVNFNGVFVDDGEIFIGDNVLIGPNVTLVTATHPIDSELRKKTYQYNKDIHIEENVWLGANVVVLPGVTIGKNTVIGAGSIVTRDIPGDVVAYGCPCKVKRKITEKDKIKQ